MMITIANTDYIDLVTGTCLANFGLQATYVDQDKQKTNFLKSESIPICEPNLKYLIQRNVSAGRFTFATVLKKTVKESEEIFIAVATPPNNDGSVNFSQIETVARQIVCYLNNHNVIINKNTVPIGTVAKITQIIQGYQRKNKKTSFF